MWDLIVSVPDHCLSFYFIMGKMVSPPFLFIRSDLFDTYR